jgi:hypothetical protein
MREEQSMTWRIRALVSGEPACVRIGVPLLALLGLLFLGGGWTPALADTPNGITVTGSGSAEVPPDLAHLSGSVDNSAGTAQDALDQNSRTVQAVLAALAAAGVPSKDIQTSRVDVTPAYDYKSTPAQIVGYRASNTITVKTTDLTRIGDLLTTMVQSGVNNLNDVSYGIQNPEQLRMMALEAALGDARQLAQTIASDLGVALGAILNVTTTRNAAPPASFGAPPPPPPSAPRPAATSTAAPPVRPSPLSATSDVQVTYSIAGR